MVQMVQIAVLMDKLQLEVVLVALIMMVHILVVLVVQVVAVQRLIRQFPPPQVVQEQLDKDLEAEQDIIIQEYKLFQLVVGVARVVQEVMLQQLEVVMVDQVYLLQLEVFQHIMQVEEVVLEHKILDQLWVEEEVLVVVEQQAKVQVLMPLQVHQIQEVVEQVLVMLDGQVMLQMAVQAL